MSFPLGTSVKHSSRPVKAGTPKHGHARSLRTVACLGLYISGRTEFGEAVSSHVTEVPFERAPQQPDVVIGARRAGLVTLGNGAAQLGFHCRDGHAGEKEVTASSPASVC